MLVNADVPVRIERAARRFVNVKKFSCGLIIARFAARRVNVPSAQLRSRKTFSRFALNADEDVRVPSTYLSEIALKFGAARSVRTCRSALPGLVSSNCVEEERISRQRLAAILRAKAEENDAAFAQTHFDQGGFAFDAIAAKQPTGQQRILVFGIRGDDLHARQRQRIALDFKYGRVLDPGNRFFRHSCPNRIVRVELNVQNRPWHIEIRAWQTVRHVANRQLELLNREIRRAIETDKRPALFDKLAQSFHALFTQTSCVFGWHSVFAVAVEDGIAGLIRNDDSTKNSYQVSRTRFCILQQ